MREYNRISVIAVTVGSMVLLGKRALLFNNEAVPLGGHWALFGGAVGDGESPLFAAQRELHEETEIWAPLPIQYIQTLTEDSNERELYFYEKSFKDYPPVVLNFEHTEYGWFSRDSLKSFPEPIAPNISEILDWHYRRKEAP